MLDHIAENKVTQNQSKMNEAQPLYITQWRIHYIIRVAFLYTEVIRACAFDAFEVNKHAHML